VMYERMVQSKPAAVRFTSMDSTACKIALAALPSIVLPTTWLSVRACQYSRPRADRPANDERRDTQSVTLFGRLGELFVPVKLPAGCGNVSWIAFSACKDRRKNSLSTQFVGIRGTQFVLTAFDKASAIFSRSVEVGSCSTFT